MGDWVCCFVYSMFWLFCYALRTKHSISNSPQHVMPSITKKRLMMFLVMVSRKSNFYWKYLLLQEWGKFFENTIKIKPNDNVIPLKSSF